MTPFIAALFRIFAGGSAPIGGTWDPARKGANVSLSGGNLIATAGSGLWQSVFGTGVTPAGATSWFRASTGSVAINMGVGIASPTANVADYIGADGQSAGYFASGNLNYNGVNTPGLTTWGAGDVIRTIWNEATKTVTWEKNGVAVPGASINYSTFSGAASAAASVIGSDSVTGDFTT